MEWGGCSLFLLSFFLHHYRRFSDFWPRMSTILQNCGCFLPSHLSLPSQFVWSLLIWGILWAPRKAQHP